MAISGDNELESPNLSQWVWGGQHSGQGSHQHPARKSRSLRWERVQVPSSAAEPPAANAKGHQRGVEQPSGVWGLAISAVVWSPPPLHL